MNLLPEKIKFRFTDSQIVIMQMMIESKMAQIVPFGNGNMNPKERLVFNLMVKIHLWELKQRLFRKLEGSTEHTIKISIPFVQASAFHVAFPYASGKNIDETMIIQTFAFAVDPKL